MPFPISTFRLKYKCTFPLTDRPVFNYYQYQFHQLQQQLQQHQQVTWSEWSECDHECKCGGYSKRTRRRMCDGNE